MKKIILLYLLILVIGIMQAQQLGTNLWYASQNDTSNQIIHLSSEGYYGSTIFNNQMTHTFFRGGFVDKAMKDKALAKAKRVNYLGGEFNSQLMYSDTKNFLFKDFGYYVGISYHYQTGIQFTKDLYELMFYGNKPFAGKEAILTQSGALLRDFNQISFGLNKKNKIKVGVSLLSYNNRMQAEITKGKVTTDSSGQHIDVELMGGYTSVDSSRSTALFSNNAMGIGIDFEYTYQLKKGVATSSRINIGVKNLGWVQQKSAYVLSSGHPFTYKGVEIGDIAKIGDSISAQMSSLKDSLSIQSGVATVNTSLPFEVYFYQVPSYRKKLELIYGFRYKNQVGYKVFLYAGGNINIKQYYNLSSYLSYGGYTNLQWGATIQKRGEKINIGLNTGNLLGFITNKVYGKSLGISLIYLL